MLRKITRMVITQAVLLCALSLGLWSQNLLAGRNPDFNNPWPGVPIGTAVSYTNYCYSGNSAAAWWQIWVNSCSPGEDDISTVLIPSTLPGSTGYMLHVVTDGDGNGIDESAIASHPNTLSSIWVYINSGCIFIGTGDGGDTGFDEGTCETGRWFHFSKVPNGISPATEFLVFSFGNGADFYVKDAIIVPAP